MSTLSERKQYSTFMISNNLYGIDVMKVQEITKALPMTRVPLAPKYVKGLINLRGQISTAICLKELFQIGSNNHQDSMNVVCRLNDILVSFLVDQIGDVLELEDTDFEPIPDTVPKSIKQFVKGVYKTPGKLLTVIDTEKIAQKILDESKQATLNANH
jgi:purine-binding chemotaxis protein CheW